MKNLLLMPFLFFAMFSFADDEAVHGMVIFGKQATYVSHLPMFHSPHDYQFVAEVELPPAAKSILTHLRTGLTQELFTIAPLPMDLSKVVDGTIKSFPATVYKGHFEQGGQQIGKTTLTVKKILIGKKLESASGTTSEFLAFGKSNEYFATHFIKGEPSYDAIYRTAKPFKTVFPPCGRAGCPDPYDAPLNDNQLPLTIEANAEEFSTKHPINVAIGKSSAQVRLALPFYIDYGFGH